QGLLRHAFAAHAWRHAVGILRRSSPFAVLAIAVAAEMQLVLVTLEEVFGEGGVARQGIVGGVGGGIGEQVGIIAEQLVADPVRHNRAGGVGFLLMIVGADIGPEGVGMADELGRRVCLEDRPKTLDA